MATKRELADDKQRLQKQAFVEALKRNLGIITTACEKVGIVRQTFYNWMAKDPEFAEQVRGIKELTLDFVESQLLKQIEGGNTTATIFYLKTQGKQRGYVETQEIITAEKVKAPTWFE